MKVQTAHRQIKNAQTILNNTAYFANKGVPYHTLKCGGFFMDHDTRKKKIRIVSNIKIHTLLNSTRKLPNSKSP